MQRDVCSNAQKQARKNCKKFIIVRNWGTNLKNKIDVGKVSNSENASKMR